MQINVTYDQSISSLPTGFVTAVNYVVNYFDGLFTNNCTINIDVGYGECAGSSWGGALGESSANYDFVNYNSVVSALLAQNAPGSSTLPATSPLVRQPYNPSCRSDRIGAVFSRQRSLRICRLQQYGSVGLHDGDTVSGSILFNWHDRARVYGGNGPGIVACPTTILLHAMDLFRYSSPGVRDLTAGGSGSTAYFSVDGGVTNLGTWNNNPNNGDLGDWISRAWERRCQRL